MEIHVDPRLEKDSRLATAVRNGNQYFQSLESRFRDDVSVEWKPANGSPAETDLALTLHYRPGPEVTSTIRPAEIKEPQEFERRLSHTWNHLLGEISRYHLERVREGLANLDEE